MTEENKMDYTAMINSCSTLKELFKLWEQKSTKVITYKNSKKEDVSLTIDHAYNLFIKDGIVNEDKWNNSEIPKILFVMKEAYDSRDSGWDRELAEWINRGECWKYKIWRRIAQWTFGLLNTTTEGIFPYTINEITEEEYKLALQEIAVINLKKSGGKSSSNYDEIAEYAKYDCEEIKKEFELIDPDIVICGFTFNVLRNIVFKNEIEEVGQHNANWYYFAKVNGRVRLFIDYYHPANRFPDLLNYYGLVNIYQQAIIENDRKGLDWYAKCNGERPKLKNNSNFKELQRILENAIKQYCSTVQEKETINYFEEFLTNLDEVANGRLSSDAYSFAFYYHDEENGERVTNAIEVLLFSDAFKIFRERRPADSKELVDPQWYVMGYRDYGEFNMSEEATVVKFIEIEKIITCEKTKLKITEWD